jgi:hypothetical protein
MSVFTDIEFYQYLSTVKYCYSISLIQLLSIADTETTKHHCSYAVHIHTVFLCILLTVILYHSPDEPTSLSTLLFHWIISTISHDSAIESQYHNAVYFSIC